MLSLTEGQVQVGQWVCKWVKWPFARIRTPPPLSVSYSLSHSCQIHITVQQVLNGFLVTVDSRCCCLHLVCRETEFPGKSGLVFTAISCFRHHAVVGEVAKIWWSACLNSVLKKSYIFNSCLRSYLLIFLLIQFSFFKYFQILTLISSLILILILIFVQYTIR